MFAVIKTGGKQYKVSKNDVINVEKIDGNLNSKISLDKVLMIGQDSKPAIIGSPMINGVSVEAEILDQCKDDKVIIFKKRRRQNSRRKNGHRQNITKLKILDIITKS